MKKILCILTLAFLLSVPALAGADDHRGRRGGGYTGPGGPAPITVAQALKLPDDARVSLSGRIEKQLGHEKYQFRDDTGTVALEIDDDVWGGLNVGPNDKVLIYGEVDKEWNRFKIEVDRIAKK